MNREEMVRISRKFFEAMNRHDVDEMGRLCSGNVVADEVAEPEPFLGLEAFKKSYSDLFQGYPDCAAEVIEEYVDGDNVIVQVQWRATNSGLFRGAEPTGKKVDIRIAYFFKIEEGQISKITEYYDAATILVQQGQLEM